MRANRRDSSGDGCLPEGLGESSVAANGERFSSIGIACVTEPHVAHSDLLNGPSGRGRTVDARELKGGSVLSSMLKPGAKSTKVEMIDQPSTLELL